MLEKAREEQANSPQPGPGLLGGLTKEHIQILNLHPFAGGHGCSYEEIGQMTLDQVWARLFNRSGEKGSRTSKQVSPLQAAHNGTFAADGGLEVTTSEGQRKKLSSKGKSLAQRLRDEAVAAGRDPFRRDEKVYDPNL